MLWNIPRNVGYTKVPIATEAANLWPSIAQPIRNRIILHTPTTTDTLIPV